jgi:hypothetical protein
VANGGDVPMPRAGPVLVRAMAWSPPLLPSPPVSRLLAAPPPPEPPLDARAARRASRLAKALEGGKADAGKTDAVGKQDDAAADGLGAAGKTGSDAAATASKV